MRGVGNLTRATYATAYDAFQKTANFPMQKRNTMVRTCGVYPRGVLSIPVSAWALSGASERQEIRECAAYLLPPSGMAHGLLRQKKGVGLHKDGLMVLAGEFLRYVVVGGLAFLADFGTLVFAQECFLKQLSCGVYIATVFGFVVGLAVNYVLSLWFVFTQKKDRGKGRSVGAFLVFGIIGFMGLGWTELGMWVGIELLKWNYMIVKVLVTGAVLVWNYLGRKLLIFNSKGEAGR